MVTTYVGDVPITTDKQFRSRDEDDFYETDINGLTTYLRDHFPYDLSDSKVLDPGAGTGVYGRVIKNLFRNTLVAGIEKNAQRFPQPDEGYDIWMASDYLQEGYKPHFGYILGNPPYKHAEAFFWRSRELLAGGTGTIDFLLRLGFLESERRYKSMYTYGFKPTKVTVLSTRPSFTGDGKTYPAAFAFFRWDFKDGKANQRCEFDFMTFERDTNGTDGSTTD